MTRSRVKSHRRAEELAASAELDERYVREWLGAMVAARIVHYDVETSSYELPDEHAAFLTRSSTPNNMAVLAQFIPVLANVEDQILTCFEQGGGVPYESYPRFHEVMAEHSDQTVVSLLIEAVLPLVPGLGEQLTAGIDVLDVGCGRGRALQRMAQQYPASRFVGIDLCADAVEAGNAEAAQLELSNLRFEVSDAASVDGTYDFITAFDAIHDQAAPADVLLAVRCALRTGGTFLMQDIRASSHVHKNLDHPAGPLLYALSCMHCMSVSLSQGGAGLGAVWGEELATEMLQRAGFGQVEVRRLPHDVQNNYYVAQA